MSECPSNETENHNLKSTEEVPEKRKLSLSHSENSLDQQKNIRQKLLGKVKSWSSKDQHLEDKCISVELDLVRSLSRLEVNESIDDINTNLLRARDSLENLVKDEQNMPRTSLDRSIILPKPRNISESPKSSPQLAEKSKAASSSASFWDPYDRQGKKNRKDMKKKQNKLNKNVELCRNENRSPSAESTKNSIMKRSENKDSGETSVNEDTSTVEDENLYKYKYFPKNSKSVVFTNEVLVVYFNNEDVVGEEKEPLKKEVEQQTRNKEMRRTHLNKTQEKYNLCLF